MSSRNEPLVVDLVRSGHIESSHVVHAVVVDVTGTVRHSWGDPDRVVHPRSAVKMMQALPLVESGAADAFGLSESELALACASHAGEPGHVEAVAAWLDRIGCSPADLECGVQAGRGESPVGNNCSGKHAGFLTLARHLGVPTQGYTEADHPVQRLVTDALADTTGSLIDPADAGIDGCGIPVHPLALQAIACAGARFGASSAPWPPERVEAAGRLCRAMLAHPWNVAGSGRLDSELMTAGQGRLLAKGGAEGVQLAVLLDDGLGMAIKATDGAGRAAGVALGAVLARLGHDDLDVVFAPHRQVRNHAGRHVADLVVR